MVTKPTTRDAIVTAMVEGLVSPNACETFIRAGVRSCALCEAQTEMESVHPFLPPITHGPYCPVTLARRLRDGDYQMEAMLADTSTPTHAGAELPTAQDAPTAGREDSGGKEGTE